MRAEYAVPVDEGLRLHDVTSLGRFPFLKTCHQPSPAVHFIRDVLHDSEAEPQVHLAVFAASV